MDPFLVGGALYLLFGGKGGGAPSKTAKRDAAGDGALLQVRANQPDAKKWLPFFQNQGATPMLADALCRWTGIESSGNPTKPSSKGELGLLQCMQTTALQAGGPYTLEDWTALGDKKTTNEEQARLGIKLYKWCWARAKRLITNAPDGILDSVWYAKLYHQRPRDVKTGQLHGPAIMMARELAENWKDDARKMHYLRSANVVAFGVPQP